MSIEQETLAPIKNLENQIRLFIYDNCQNHHCPHLFPPMFNLLSYVTPLKFLLKEMLITEDEEREEELIYQLIEYYELLIKDFRLLANHIGNEEGIRDVWFSLYQAHFVIEEWTGCDFFCGIEESEPYLES